MCGTEHSARRPSKRLHQSTGANLLLAPRPIRGGKEGLCVELLELERQLVVIVEHPLDLNTAASLDDLREAMTILEEIHRTARRVLGGAHPLTEGMELDLRDARPALRAREATSK